jgi:cytochrome c oxidase subunit I+III
MLAREKTRLWTPGVLFLCAALALALGTALDLWSWIASGLRPDQSGQGATVYALLSLDATLAAVGLLMAAYISARNSRGMIVRPRNNSLDLCVLWVLYAAGQGTMTALVTRAFGES